MNSPTQQSHSLCQCEIGFAREKKCSFIRADFYLNDAFQLNSLKLLLPPQNVSISKQGSLGFFHFADRKRKSIEKTCCLFKSHHQPQTARHLWGFIPQAHLFPMASRGLLLFQPLEKEHKNIGRTDMCKSTHIWRRKVHRSFPLFFSFPGVLSLFVCLFFKHTPFVSYFRTKASYRQMAKWQLPITLTFTSVTGSQARILEPNSSWPQGWGKGLLPCKSRGEEQVSGMRPDLNANQI